MIKENAFSRNNLFLSNIGQSIKKAPPAIWMVLLLLVVFGFTTNNFLTTENFINIAVQCAPLFVIACGQTMVVLIQGTDLSLGASLNMVTVVWVFLMRAQIPVLPATLIAILTAVIAGLINGVVVSKLKLPIFIATLGMANILNSIALTISNGASIYYPVEIHKLIAKSGFLGIPNIVWIAILCFVVTWILLNLTRFGSRVRSLGGNAEALRFAGFSIDKATIQVFTFTGLMAGIAGIMLSSRIESGNPIVGNGFEFNSVAAVLLGGTSMREGRGGIVGTIFGVLFVQILKNGLVMMNVSSIYQSAIIGFVVLFAIIIDAYIRRNQ